MKLIKNKLCRRRYRIQLRIKAWFKNRKKPQPKQMSEYICPQCKKPIYDDEALLCLYCGGSLNRSVGFMGKLKYPTPRIISSIVVVLTLIGFILLISIFSGCRSIYVGGSGKVGEVTGSGGVNIPVPTK